MQETFAEHAILLHIILDADNRRVINQAPGPHAIHSLAFVFKGIPDTIEPCPQIRNTQLWNTTLCVCSFPLFFAINRF